MKPFITSSAIALLAAFALVGCNKDNTATPTDAPTTNTSFAATGTNSSTSTNMPPKMNTNTPTMTN